MGAKLKNTQETINRLCKAINDGGILGIEPIVIPMLGDIALSLAIIADALNERKEKNHGEV